MKAIKYWAACFALLSLVACSKSELQSSARAEEAAVVSTIGTDGAAKWSSVANAGVSNDAVAFAGEVKDEAITEEVLESGMVLVFAKSGNLVQSLPFQESGSDLKYWYYHVSLGSVFIQANAASRAATAITAKDFAVVVLTQAQLEKLEGNGTSRDLLLGMSLDQVNNLVK